jgi:hypothetical protein
MGSSQIAAIYSALAALAPTPSTDTVVRVQGYGSVTSQVHTDDLPMRKLQAFANESGAEFAFVALGKTVQTTWTVVDRFLYRHATQGEGWEAFSDDLTSYSASYVGLLKANRALGLPQVHVVEARFVPGIFSVPEGAGNRIAGVDVILTIAEVIS